MKRKMNMKKILLIIFLLFHTPLLFGKKINWKLVKSGNGIQVYHRKTPGSDFKEFMGVTYINTSLHSLVALLDDTTSYSKWLHNCKKAKLLKKINLFERFTYMVTRAPWPVSNRDYVVYSKISQNKITKTVKITLKGKLNFLPHKTGLVRMKKLNGHWLFIPAKNGKIKVKYQILSDPGGAIPSSLINQKAKDIPYYTLLNMKKIVNQDKYKNKRYGYIQ